MSTLQLKNKPALVIVDAQNSFCHPDGVFSRNAVQVPPKSVATMIGGIQRLRNAFHQKELPVIFVGYGFNDDYSNAGSLFDKSSELAKNGMLKRGSWDAELVDELKLDGSRNEMFVEKYRFNSFHETKLAQLLTEHSIDQIIVTGCATNFCVESTVRSAHDHGYHAVTISDATATVTEEEQRMALANLQWFGSVANCDEVEQALGKL